jgi:hypothetical protein
LVKWEIEVSDSDVLYINKTINGGPEKIKKYLDFTRNLRTKIL